MSVSVLAVESGTKSEIDRGLSAFAVSALHLRSLTISRRITVSVLRYVLCSLEREVTALYCGCYSYVALKNIYSFLGYSCLLVIWCKCMDFLPLIDCVSMWFTK